MIPGEPSNSRVILVGKLYRLLVALTQQNLGFSPKKRIRFTSNEIV